MISQIVRSGEFAMSPTQPLSSSPGRRIRAGWSPLVLALGLMLGLGGCAPVGPDYAPPQPQAPPAWHTTLDDGLRVGDPDPAGLAAWWSTLKDPVLSGLIKAAITGNLDLKQAQARVREARAQRGISQADLLPTLDASGTVGRQRTSLNTGGTGKETDLYSAGFDAGWEIDIFGGLRRSVEAAQADLEASQADLRDVLVTLTAEVARDYVEARTYQTRLAVALDNLGAQRETFELIQSRFDAGLSDELALQQARYNLEDTRSQIPNLRIGLAQALNRLAVLLGQLPGQVHSRLEPPAKAPVTPPTVALGVPAEMLRRRPDIRKAERQLAAQTARIGVATAELYPKFRLAGSIGLESFKSGDLFKAASQAWSIGPSFSWRIFDAGAIRRNIEVQDARQEQYLYAYQAAVLGALREVENAITSYVQEQLRRDRLQAAVDAARRAEQLARAKYQAGLVDFSNVLDAQRSLFSYQDQLATSEGTVTSDLVSLYKTLGGGWQSLAAQAEAGIQGKGKKAK